MAIGNDEAETTEPKKGLTPRSGAVYPAPMHYWIPEIKDGKAADGQGTVYWPNLWLILNGQEDARFGYATAATTGDVDIAKKSLEEAIEWLEIALTKFFRPGDEITWVNHRYLEVPAAITAIRANPETQPYES